MSLTSQSSTQNLFFKSDKKREFSDVLNEVQSYISSKYSALVIDGINNVISGNDEVKLQVKRYIGKYLLDYRISVEGLTQIELVDKLYTEMAEFSFLTKYIFGTGIEKININSWDDIEVQYSNKVYTVSNIVYPDGGSQLVWCKWHTPNTEQIVNIKVTVTGGASANKTNIVAKIVDLNKNPPPDPTADDRNDGFRAVSVPGKAQRTSASWSVWSAYWQPKWVWHSNWRWVGFGKNGRWVDRSRWVDEGEWKFRSSSYSVSMNANMRIICDEKNPTAVGRTMKSGYGINEKVTGSVSGNGEHTALQNAVAYFPEFYYTPRLWRNGEQLPSVDGLIVGCVDRAGSMTALVDDADIHTLMIGASGVGKTANFLYPNIEYCCAAGMSFVTTDSKGDLYRNTATIAEKYYGYKISVIDLRNPTRSSGYNMLYLVNKYMDAYKFEGKLEYKAKSEKFAKITAKTIISADGDVSSMGQNAFFYEAAEGLLTAVILLIAEFCPPEKRHIISVFKLIQDLLAPSGTKGVSRFQMLIDKLPGEHKARWFAGAALNSSDQAMASVMSTALSRLNSFIDSELEQILCFDTSIDVEEFCNSKSAIYLVLPEEDATKHFLISLIFQQLYREILTVADEKGGQLDKRVMFYMDEIGTLPKVDGLEMIFSASRSRKVSIVAIIQSLAQFEKTYGKEGAEIIVDNCQCTLFGAFAPNSKTAEAMSQNLGKQTVLSGTVTRSSGRDGGNRQLQMIERPLITVDELKSMPKGHFIVMKTGCHPTKTRLNLFFKWGIAFEDAYSISEKSERKVQYADSRGVEAAVLERFPPKPVPIEFAGDYEDMRIEDASVKRHSPRTRKSQV